MLGKTAGQWPGPHPEARRVGRSAAWRGYAAWVPSATMTPWRRGRERARDAVLPRPGGSTARRSSCAPRSPSASSRGAISCTPPSTSAPPADRAAAARPGPSWGWRLSARSPASSSGCCSLLDCCGRWVSTRRSGRRLPRVPAAGSAQRADRQRMTSWGLASSTSSISAAPVTVTVSSMVFQSPLPMRNLPEYVVSTRAETVSVVL